MVTSFCCVSVVCIDWNQAVHYGECCDVGFSVVSLLFFDLNNNVFPRRL